MELVEVDPLQAQPPQASLAGLAQVLGAAVALPPPGPGPRQAPLGRDHEAAGVGVERLGDQLLAHLGPVGVGGVDEVDAELDGAAQDRLRALAVGRRPPDALAGDPHRAEPEPAHLEVAAERDGSSRGCVGRLESHRLQGYPRPERAKRCG